MQAILLAAGLGTRLQPLTNDRPKALVQCGEKTLLDHAIGYLITQGISYVIVNVHHFGDQIIDHISRRSYPVPVVVSDERELLMDTGGALVSALPLMNDEREILIFNTDVLTNLELRGMYRKHEEEGLDATLLVEDRESSRKLAFSEKGLLTGWKNYKTGETIGDIQEESAMMAFGGIHIISLDMIRDFQRQSGTRPFSVITAYLNATERFRIGRYIIPEGTIWLETGSPERLEASASYLHRLG